MPSTGVHACTCLTSIICSNCHQLPHATSVQALHCHPHLFHLFELATLDIIKPGVVEACDTLPQRLVGATHSITPSITLRMSQRQLLRAMDPSACRMYCVHLQSERMAMKLRKPELACSISHILQSPGLHCSCLSSQRSCEMKKNSEQTRIKPT